MKKDPKGQKTKKTKKPKSSYSNMKVLGMSIDKFLYVVVGIILFLIAGAVYYYLRINNEIDFNERRKSKLLLRAEKRKQEIEGEAKTD